MTGASDAAPTLQRRGDAVNCWHSEALHLACRGLERNCNTFVAGLRVLL